jgi:hypothetical protein
LDKENYSALSIIQYLYRHSQNNPKLIKLFYNTKTTAQKENDNKPIWQNNSDYYSLVEVWIRLYEILKNISIQWWIDRQSKYDQIIGGIIQRKDVDTFKTRDYPELQELSVFCKQTNPGLIFDRLYISTKEIRETTEKKQSLSKLQMSMIITAVALFWVLAWWFGWFYLLKSKQKADQKRLEEKIIKSTLDATSIYFYGLNNTYDYWKDFEKKQEYLESIATSMFNFLVEVYGPTKTPDIVKWVIITELLRVYERYQLENWKIKQIRNIERFFHKPLDYSIMEMNDFVIDILVPNNAYNLNKLWYNTTPYNQFLQYKSDFDAALSTKWEFKITSNKIMWDHVDTNSTGLSPKYKYTWSSMGLDWWYEKEDIWTYYDYHEYNYYHFVKLTTHNNKTIILASKGTSPSRDYKNEMTFSLKDAKEGIQKIKKYQQQPPM